MTSLHYRFTKTFIKFEVSDLVLKVIFDEKNYKMG